MTSGITYVAFGAGYREQAERSASRVAELGDWPICVITDEDEFEDRDLFDHVVVGEPETDWRQARFGADIKPTFLPESPFDRTLYLDTDTYVVEADAIRELFAVLDGYELAAAHDVAQKIEHQYGSRASSLESTPESFPWLNTGVVAYRQTEAVRDLFETWKATYRKQHQHVPGINDQSSFAEALYYSDVSHTVLPPEYNHRVSFQQTHIGQVKIIHGHAPNLAAIADYLNGESSDAESATLGMFNALPLHSVGYYERGEQDAVESKPTRLVRPLPVRLRTKLRRFRRRLSVLRERGPLTAVGSLFGSDGN